MAAAMNSSTHAEGAEPKLIFSINNNNLKSQQFDFFNYFPLTNPSAKLIKYGDVKSETKENSNNYFNSDPANIQLFLNYNAPFKSISYSDLTNNLARNFKDTNIFKCSEIIVQALNADNCNSRQSAQEMLQLHKSIQAFAKALELSGTGLTTRAQEDLIKNDIRNYGLDLGLVTPAMQLARIYAADEHYFGERGQSIYQLSNLALGYLYTPEYRLPNPLNNVGIKELEQLYLDLETCGFIDVQPSKTISLLEYEHPALSNELADYAIMDEYNNEVIFFPEAQVFEYYNLFAGLDVYNSTHQYSLRGSTSPYDISQIDAPDLFGLSIVDRHASLVIEDISGGQRWKANNFDAFQSGFDGPVPFEYYASGAVGISSCRVVCMTRPGNISKLTRYGYKVAKDFKNAAINVYTAPIHREKAPYKIISSLLSYTKSIFGATVTTRTINNECKIECYSIEHSKEDLNFHNYRKDTIESELVSLEHRLSELKNKEIKLKEDLVEKEKEIKLHNEKFDEAKENLDKKNYGTDDTEKERNRLEEEKKIAHQKEEQAAKEASEKQEQIKKNEQEQKKTESEIDSKKEELNKTQDEIKEAEIDIKEKEEKLIGHKNKFLSCDDEAFTMPPDTICIFDPEAQSWRLIADQEALDKRAYLHVCARVTVSPGSVCVIMGGKPVIVSRSVDRNGFPKFPIINHCDTMYLSPGSTCTMVDGRPVINNPTDTVVRGQKPPELSTSFCHYVKVEEGYTCIEDTNGQPMIQSDEGASIQLLNLIQNSREKWCHDLYQKLQKQRELIPIKVDKFPLDPWAPSSLNPRQGG
jgi:flagellar biosynthesis GTPase FlhF